MRKQNRTVPTIHGDINYKTVQCSNCENEFLPEETIVCGIDIRSKEIDHMSNDAYTTNFAKKYTLCWDCSEAVFGYSKTNSTGIYHLLADKTSTFDRVRNQTDLAALTVLIFLIVFFIFPTLVALFILL